MTNINKLTKEELLNWLKNEAGVNHPNWFGDNLKYGGLEIQQIPEEYVEYLWFLKNHKFESYLNIGVGKGGSFLIETYIQPLLKLSVAIDNSSYWGNEQKNTIRQNISFLQKNTNTKIVFFDGTSRKFFDEHPDEKFDIIFIDGDHSYDGVKFDFINSEKLLKKDGYLVFHDIASHQCSGVNNLWNEIKKQNCLEFIKSDKCGIGIWKK